MYETSKGNKERIAPKWNLMLITISGVFLCCARTSAAASVLQDQSTTTQKWQIESDPKGDEALDGRPTSKDCPRMPVVKSSDDSVCFSPECVHTASSVLKNMDPTIEPCDDFHQFACGGFLKSTIIPDDQVSVNPFSVINDKLQEQLRMSIEAESEPNERKPFRLVKSLYKSCMNKPAIEEQGLEPLHKILRKFGGWPVVDGEEWNDDDFDWKSSVYKFRDVGYSVDYFLTFHVEADPKNTTTRVIHLDQPSLGLSREFLLEGFDDEIVQAYYNYMVDIAVILGAKKENAMKELKESLLFEMKLANISLPNEKRRNATQLYNPMTMTELTKNYPSVPWREYFSKLLPSSITIEDNEVAIVFVPSYISELEKLVSITPKRIQANYVMWRAAASSVIYLNDEIRKRELAYSTVLFGKTERESRWKECIDIVSERLALSVGAMYVRKYFNKEAKKNAVEMVMDIKQQFNKILQQVDWMDDKTKQSALEKADSMASHIGYPDELLDDNKLEELYENLELSEGNYLESILNLSLFDTEDSFSKLRKPVNKTDWVNRGTPAMVNAFYSALENSIEFPAGILQGALFSNDRPRYMNYGAIGFVIGHEITHGFDDKGRQFDKDGNLVDWWAPSTKENYLKRAQCIIDQYGNYTVDEVGLQLNGINTQGENIADNGAVKEAYLAYNNWVARNGQEKKLPGLPYTPNQMFWISAANMWCWKYTPEILKTFITTGVHSPAEFRTVGPFSNMPEFSKDFNCPIGSKMNPEKKCSVW